MWHIANYEPTALFSLRPANATTSGGKTLLTPTPFAIKMALLDVTYRVYGNEAAKKWFPYLRDAQIAVCLPDNLVVIKTFIKILRPHKSGAKDMFGTGLVGPMGNTISYRELVQFGGNVQIAVTTMADEEMPPIDTLLSHIHYLGKRGGFFQYVGRTSADQLPKKFTHINPEPGAPFSAFGTMQLLDDFGSKMSLTHADVFNNKGLSIGKPNGRLLNPVILPYRLSKSSRSYSLYEKIE